MEIDGLIVQTPQFATGGKYGGYFIRTVTNPRQDAAALVVLDYTFIDEAGNPLDIGFDRTSQAQDGLLIPPGQTLEDHVFTRGDNSGIKGIATTVKSVTWLPSITPGYEAPKRLDETCRQDEVVGCLFFNPNPYGLRVVPALQLCYTSTTTSGTHLCNEVSWFWRGKAVLIAPGSTEMVDLTEKQVRDVGLRWDELPPSDGGLNLGYYISYWLSPDQPNWPAP